MYHNVGGSPGSKASSTILKNMLHAMDYTIEDRKLHYSFSHLKVKSATFSYDLNIEVIGKEEKEGREAGYGKVGEKEEKKKKKKN